MSWDKQFIGQVMWIVLSKQRNSGSRGFRDVSVNFRENALKKLSSLKIKNENIDVGLSLKF